MLRALVAALLLANLGFYVWTLGWLDNVVGVRAIGDREPERLARQVRPDALVLLPASAGSAVVSKAAACLEAGPYAGAEGAAAETAVRAALPAGSWSVVTNEIPGAWLVYMGRFDAETLLRKEAELKRLRVDFEPLPAAAALGPGFTLGRYEQRSAAEQALAGFTQRGVRTARVVELTPPSSALVLRVERAEPALAARLVTLRAEALGRGFVPCAAAAAGPAASTASVASAGPR